MSDTEQVSETSTTGAGDAKIGCGAIAGILFVILLFIGWIAGGTIDAPRADVELRLAQGVAGRSFQFYPMIEELDGEKVSVGFSRLEVSQLMGVPTGGLVSSESIEFAMKMVAADGPVVIVLGPDEQIVGATADGWPIIEGKLYDRTILEMVGIASAIDTDLDQNEFRLWIESSLKEFSSSGIAYGQKKVDRRSFGDLGASLSIVDDEVFTDRGMKPGTHVILGLSP
jgi:hypothetical protein